ncbi:unnamed protein product [Penicillium salamii]|uniref:NACHT domain-containing protein n=1 Tax=Penicillium salamii TaxID=1612424 RepID=A0A9W4NRZ6_9EURO|nr:unnamed protein product [Penicillium salamii]CAG8404246.1 unnamed protein product [Penicillium salamii]CAG8413442.1 unnamed protein product [Penicillium salamii]CAG8417637.1 unnamed protein product [Penicillium salamii]
MVMELGFRERVSLAGIVVLLCVWYSYKRPLSKQESEQTTSVKNVSPKEDEFENRPPIDVLYPSPNSQDAEEAEVDIVAVHGLGSQADWSWTWKDETQANGKPRLVNWLKDKNMLPSVVRKTRILSYNYESRWHKNASKTRLQICGEELVNAVHDFRKGISDRPLIFIGHSLGGNVIQHGLMYSDSEPKFQYLVEVTVGLIFLGCPFKGSKIQEMASVVTSFLQVAGSDSGIIRDLRYGDPVLLDKIDVFQRLLERNTIPFCAFIERKETDYGKKIGLTGIWKELVVDEESAGALGPHKFHLNTDHFKINKFSGPLDRSFLTVSSQINEMFTNWKPLVESRKAGSNRPGAQRKLMETKERHEKIVQFLAKFDFSARYRDVFSARHKMTGQWFVEAETFKTWVDRIGQRLWCPGIPGAGKTVLLAVAINHLQERFFKPDEVVLFAFCDYKDQQNQSAENILLSLWRQLMQKRVLGELECEYLETTYLKRGVFPTTDALVKLLSDEISKYSRVFILLDALDELRTENRDSLQYLLRQLPAKINLLMTSRVPKETTLEFRDVPQLEIRARDRDITDYINGRLDSVSKLRSKVEHNHKLKEEIRSTITKKADGMFLLVKLHLNSLASKHTVKEMRTDLRNLPEGENAISDTYEGAFSRIRDQTREDRELGEKIIMWISHAQRPLTMKDLQSILTLQEEDTDLDFDDLIPEEFLVSTCAGLVTVENLSGRIQFVHSTAQEFVDSTKSTRYPDADLKIAHSCLHYLSLSMFCRETKEIHTTSFTKTVSRYPFLEYAALFWGIHAGHAESVTAKSLIEKSVRNLFNLRLQSAFAIRTLLCGVAGIDGAEMGDNLARNDRSVKLINIMAYFGLDFIVSELISNRPETIVESFDHFVGNVLHWAALGQHDTTLRLLLCHTSAGDVLNQKGYSEFTPLHLALVYRRDLSAEIILDYGPDVQVKAHFEHTPLLVASLTGNSGIIPKLLSADTEKKTLLMQGHGSTTPFRAAAMWGHKDVMVELLRALEGCEISEELYELRDDLWRNPMHQAAEGGHLSVCEVLLRSKHGVQLATSEDEWSMIPMDLAILHGHVELAELFLNWDNRSLLANDPGSVAGALTLAAHFGQPMVADMLLARHPEACASDFRNFTPLHHAAYSGSVETVKVIMGFPAGISTLEARDKSGNTPLVGAAARGQAETVEYLLQMGADINAKDENEMTALHVSCQRNLDQVVKTLLLRSDSDIDLDAKTSEGKTALALAIESQVPEAVKLLLKKGAKIPDGVDLPESIGKLEQYYPETPVDQLKAYFYLKQASRQKLSQPLISNILDLAEYWIVNKTERYESKLATNLDGDTLVYLRSPPVQGNLHHPVRRIEYEVISHDQGFSGDYHVHGTYECSHTWFDASRECSPGPFHGSASRLLGPMMLRNVHARSDWHTHRITWCCIRGARTVHVRTDDETKEEIEEAVTTVQPDHRNPRPEPVKWITEINPGERLLMTAMAQFPGWANYVQRAKIVVYTSCLKSSGLY